MTATKKTMEAGPRFSEALTPQVAAATATEKAGIIFSAPYALRVTRLAYAASVAATGDDTNTKNINVLNGGTGGTGTTEVAHRDLVTGVNDVAGVLNELTVSTPIPMAAGEVLLQQTEKVGSGVQVGPYRWLVEWEPY